MVVYWMPHRAGTCRFGFSGKPVNERMIVSVSTSDPVKYTLQPWGTEKHPVILFHRIYYDWKDKPTVETKRIAKHAITKKDVVLGTIEQGILLPANHYAQIYRRGIMIIDPSKSNKTVLHGESSGGILAVVTHKKEHVEVSPYVSEFDQVP